MNYDETNIPAVYDIGRAYSPQVLASWLDLISQGSCRDRIRRIVDIGCGTGRFSAPLTVHFDADVIAVDPSQRMLGAARSKDIARVSYACAAGEALPLRDGCVDMAFMSMVFHHFADPARAVRECRRVLRPAGIVCLRTATTDRINECPYVPFFRRSGAILGRLHRSEAFTRSTFAAAGFELVRHELVRHETAPSWQAYADKLGYRAIAALDRLSQQEFDEGLDALHRFAELAPAGPVIEPIDFFIFRSGDPARRVDAHLSA
jgi:ubiquinone/menaquinone biosynthesis C-methylase UbiE